MRAGNRWKENAIYIFWIVLYTLLPRISFFGGRMTTLFFVVRNNLVPIIGIMMLIMLILVNRGFIKKSICAVLIFVYSCYFFSNFIFLLITAS